MNAPSVIARPLSEAQRILQAAGVQAVVTKQTSPPHGAPSGALRVVRQRLTSEGLELVVAPSAPLLEGTESHD